MYNFQPVLNLIENTLQNTNYFIHLIKKHYGL